MQIKLPPKHFSEKIDDRIFLEDLDKKLHYIYESWAETNMSRSRHKIYIDQYHSKKLEISEIEKNLSLINPETGIAMTPINTNWEFSVGFNIIYTFDKKSLLYFLEEQLPEGYDFKKLSETFNHPDNIKMLNSIGIETPKEHYHYSY